MTRAGWPSRPGWRSRLRARLPRITDARIVYRLLLVNALVVAIPLIGIAFARMHERQLLTRLEADLVNQAELVRAVLEHAPAASAAASAGASGGASGAPIATTTVGPLVAPTDDPIATTLEQRAADPIAAPTGDPIATPTAGPLADHAAMLAAAARRTRTRIRLLDAAGTVVADSHAHGPPEGAETTVSTVTGDVRPKRPRAPDPIDVSDRREVKQALAGRFGSATRIWSGENRVYLFVALPVRAHGRVTGAVYATRSTAPVKAALYELRRWLFLVAALSLLATTVVTVVLAFTISRPLTRLTRAAERIAAGDRRPIAPGLARRDEIGQLARAVDRMATELDRRAAASRELAADASHELRAPLSGIQGAAELLRDGAADDPAARDRFLAMILDDTTRLDRLVGRLLELARADAPDAPVEDLDWSALVHAAADRVRGAPVVIDVRTRRAPLSGRRAALTSALDNLLANAAIHATPGTPVTVRVRDVATGVRTEIHNAGAPIAPALLPRVWDRFVTTRPTGTGLGLAIVRSAIELHGGTLGVTSDATHGTTFWFTLPA